MENMEIPNVKTVLHIDGFTMEIYAYRKLTEQECSLCAKQWLRQSKRKLFPKKGTVKYITTIGADL